jgi:hypothetical protein
MPPHRSTGSSQTHRALARLRALIGRNASVFSRSVDRRPSINKGFTPKRGAVLPAYLFGVCLEVLPPKSSETILVPPPSRVAVARPSVERRACRCDNH